MSPPLPKALARQLDRAVGRNHVITDPDRLVVYESDGLTAYHRRPAAVVLPGSTAELVDVVRAVRDAGMELVARGAGTGLSGGSLAGPDAVVVGTARLRSILSLDPEDRLARVEPGVINAQLGHAAAVHGLYYAPDPSSQSACTLGGNVAENSGGPHCLKYGVTSRYVTGLTVVLSDGRVVELGGAARDPGQGVDLVGLFVGSEGCFGIATEIEVRLLPVPEGVRTLLGIFDTVDAAATAVTDIIARGLLPAALEIMDGGSIRAVEESAYAAGYPVDAGAALVVEFDGTDAGLDADAAAAEECCLRAGATEVRRAADAGERARLWQGRKKAFGAMGRIAPDLLVQDATVPRSTLPEVLRQVMEIGNRYGLTVGNVFHAGDGNLHPKILFDRRDAEELERVEKASREMMKVCVDAGGTITGEHGVGVDKRKYMPLVHGPDELAAMADVKAVFDPGLRLNPGKVLPTPAEVAYWGEGARGAATKAERDAAPSVSAPHLANGRKGDTVGRLDHAEPVHEPQRPHRFEPASVSELRSLLDYARAGGARVRITGRGSDPGPGATGANRGSDLTEPAVWTVATAGLPNGIDHRADDLTVTAGAGVSLGELADLVAKKGQFLPLDPPGGPARTLGGTVAAGTPGPLVASYGAPRDLVLGATLVTGDGRVLRLGGRVMKNVAGFDLLRAVVGSRGSLGVIVDVTLRLFPIPAVDRVFTVEEAPSRVLAWARRTATAPLVPAQATVVSEGAGDGTAPRGLPGDAHTATLVVRLQGTEATVDADRARLEHHLGVELVAAPADAGIALLAGARDGAWGAPLTLVATGRPSRFDEVAGMLRGVLPGCALVGDPLLGRVRASAHEPPASDDLVGLRSRLDGAGGSLTLLRSPPELVRSVGVRGSADRAGGLAEGVRRAFDPHGVLVAAW